MEQNETAQKEIYAMACVVINGEGKILLLKRSPDKKFFPGQWAAVGAVPLSKDENMEAIAKREIKDELGLEGKILKSGEAMSAIAGGYQWHIFPFLAQIESSNVTLNDEHTEYKWVSKEELKDYNLPHLMEETITKFLGE